MSEEVGVALFGLGAIGTIHLLNLLRNNRAVIYYLVERDLAKARDIVEKYHLKDTTVVSYDNTRQVYEDDRVAAVLVCTPTFEHETIVRTALQSGKAVFCEKPISQEESGTRACYEQAEKANKPLLCSFNRRFDPAISRLQQRAHAGEIGKLHILKSCSRDHPQPSDGYIAISGGIFHDCAVHDIDMICWLVGEYPTSVYTVAHAHIDAIRSLNDVDTVVISMKFCDGTLATIDLSRYAAYGYDQRLEVFGSKGMLVSENQRPTELMSLTAAGTSRDVIRDSFRYRYADSYVNAMEHFFDVVQGKEKMSVSKSDALNVSAIATACEESYRTGLPVQLSLNSDDGLGSGDTR